MPNHRILLVDDEPYLTTLVAQSLRKRGDEVETVRDGNQGLAAARRLRPDLIITDYQMPNCDGLTMARQLRLATETADVPIIMLTGRGHRITVGEQSQTNIRVLVGKPFSMRELLMHLDEILGAARAA